MSTLKIPVNNEDHIQGKLNASVILVEYGDYECPYCGYAYLIVKRLQKHFAEKLCFVFRNFPLNEIHPHAELAAESAEFANTHGRFWEMHDLLYEHQDRLSLPTIIELTTTLGLSATELEEALANRTFQTKIRDDFLGGVRGGVNGTPTFFINSERYNGSFEYDDLLAAIGQKIS